MISCFVASFSLAVGVAKHFLSKIDSFLSLLSTLPCTNILWRSFKDIGKSSDSYAVVNLQKKKINKIIHVEAFFA